jgi:hypothetical protein
MVEECMMTGANPTMNDTLQLALIESVLLLDDVDTEALRAHCDARLMEIEDDPDLADEYWSRPIPELVEYVLAQDLQAHFGRVTELYLDGGSEVYALTSLFWDGEDDTYDITSFEGIEVCSRLGSIEAASMLSLGRPVSLAPLARLPKLSSVRVAAGAISDVDALLEAPSLEVVELGDYVEVTDADIDDVQEELRARGFAT